MKLLPLLACCLALALPTRAATDPFAEFRIPDHTWRDGSARFAFSADRHHQSTARAFDRTSSLNSMFDGGFSAGWDADALQYGFSLSTVGQWVTSHGHSGFEIPDYSQRQDGTSRQAVEDWRLVGSLRSYPWDIPVGLGVSASARGSYSQGWSSSDTRTSQYYPVTRRDEAHQAGASHRYQTVESAEVSAGFGRVRDASVVQDVHLLEERLIETGALTRSLSAGARAKLAALYYVAPAYSAAHERPDRFVWREIERVLREDGALGKGGLDPYSVLRAREPYAPPGRPMRQRGYFVSVVTEVATQRYISRLESEWAYLLYDSDILTDGTSGASSLREESSYDEATLGGAAEYHLPLGWRWQLDATARVAGPVRPDESGLNVSNRVSASWFVADRWGANASVSQNRNYFRPRGARGALATDSWATSVGTSIAYYLEDRTSLTLTISEAQSRTQYSFSTPRYFYRDARISFGISYLFLGRLDAPGLMDPVLPLK